VFIWLNLSSLARRIVESQTPGLTVAALDVGWNRLEGAEVKYRTDGPPRLELEAQAVEMKPAFLSLLSDEITVASVLIRAPSLRLERAGGRSSPSRAPEPSSVPPPVPARSLYIREIEITGGRAEFVDKTLSPPVPRYRLKDIQLVLREVRFPQQGNVDMTLSCAVEGRPEGQLTASGWINPSTQSADLKITARRLDLALLEPYLRGGLHAARGADAEVGSTLNLDMKTGRFTAQGELTLENIELPGGAQTRFMGVPGVLLVGFLQMHGNQLTIPFKFSGDINRRSSDSGLAAALADSLIKRTGLRADGIQKKVEDFEKLKEKGKELKRTLQDLFK
jgi:hypothetical protein